MGGEQLVDTRPVYFDPFAPEGGPQFYDPSVQLEETFARYREGKVSDEVGALDRLVSDVESSLMDMHFLGMFNEMRQTAAQAHAMCGEDHLALQRFGSNEYFATTFGGDDKHTGHNHAQDAGDHDDEEDGDHPERRSRVTHRRAGALVLGSKPRYLFAT